MTELDEFLKERNQAFIDLDIEYIARKLPNCPPEMRLTVLHKGRYECLTIPPELRHESAKWLRSRGLGRMTGDPLLPTGELPE